MRTLFAVIVVLFASAAAFSQDATPTPVPCPDGMVCITREAAIKSLETSDLAAAQAKQIVAQDKAIADLKDIINGLKVDLAQMSGQKTQLEADRVADRAIMMVLLQNSKKKCLPFSVCLF